MPSIDRTPRVWNARNGIDIRVPRETSTHAKMLIEAELVRDLPRYSLAYEFAEIPNSEPFAVWDGGEIPNRNYVPEPVRAVKIERPYVEPRRDQSPRVRLDMSPAAVRARFAFRTHGPKPKPVLPPAVAIPTPFKPQERKEMSFNELNAIATAFMRAVDRRRARAVIRAAYVAARRRETALALI